MLHRGDGRVLRQLSAALQEPAPPPQSAPAPRRYPPSKHPGSVPAGIGNQVRVRAQGHTHAHSQVLLTGDSPPAWSPAPRPGVAAGPVYGASPWNRKRRTGHARVWTPTHYAEKSGSPPRTLDDDVHGVGGRFHADVQFYGSAAVADAFLIAPLLQIGGFPRPPGARKVVSAFGRSSPARSSGSPGPRRGVGILPPVLIYVQLAICCSGR